MAFQIAEFNIPKGAETKAPRDMIKDTFDALSPWFAKIVNQMETVWKKGVKPTDNRGGTEVRLGKLVGQANMAKELLRLYVSRELSVAFTFANFKLPLAATTENPESLPADIMIAKAFQALQPWFEAIPKKIQPHWEGCVKANEDPNATAMRLGGLVGEINIMKTMLQNFVNGEIAKKEKSSGFSAGGEDEVEIPEKLSREILTNYMDVEIGDNDEIEE